MQNNRQPEDDLAVYMHEISLLSYEKLFQSLFS